MISTPLHNRQCTICNGIIEDPCITSCFHYGIKICKCATNGNNDIEEKPNRETRIKKQQKFNSIGEIKKRSKFNWK